MSSPKNGRAEKRVSMMENHSRKRAWRADEQELSSSSALCQHQRSLRTWKHSGRAFGVRELSSFKGFGLIARLSHPHAIDDSDPDVCQGSYGHTVGLALSAFALVIRSSPRFFSGRFPCKLVEHVAQRLQASKAFVRFRIVAALERHRSGPSQGLESIGISVTASSISPFGQQPWSQAFGGPRQRTPDRLVRMGQKKGSDLLIVGGQILDDDQQLLGQGKHQARFGSHDLLFCHQLRTVQLLEHLGGKLLGSGMPGQTQSPVISSREAACALWGVG